MRIFNLDGTLQVDDYRSLFIEMRTVIARFSVIATFYRLFSKKEAIKRAINSDKSVDKQNCADKGADNMFIAGEKSAISQKPAIKGDDKQVTINLNVVMIGEKHED